MLRKSFIKYGLLVGSLGLLVSGCGTSAPSAGNGTGGSATGSTKDTLVVANEDDINTLDPAGANSNQTLRTVNNFFDTLVTQKGSSGDVVGGLATSWTASKDGKTYTFQLRKDVKFQDGNAFTADAVKFSFDRALNTKDPYYYGPYAYPSFFEPNIQSVDVTDPNTVVFHLKQVDPTFIDNLTWSCFSIVDPAAVKQYGKDFPFHGAGTGPFEPVKWAKGQEVDAKAFAGYWGGAPKIKTLVFKSVIDDATRLSELENGTVDVVPGISPQLLPAIKAQQSLKVETSPTYESWFVIFNTSEGPLKNKLVRQALNYAVNRKDITTNLLQGMATPSSSFSYPGTWSYNPDSEIYNYDPQKAKDLLAKAGYPNGMTLKFLVPSSGSGMIAPTQLAAAIQSDLAKIGVKVEITTMDWNTYLNVTDMTSKTGTYDLAEMNWSNPADDPGLYVNYYLESNSTPGNTNGLNIGYYSDPQVNSLLQKAMLTDDQATRAQLYKQAQVLVAQNPPWLFMFHVKNFIVLQKNLQGIDANPNQTMLWCGNASFS